jgi:hypothetical protein
MKNRNIDRSQHWATDPILLNKLNVEFDFDFDPCPLHSDFDGLDPKLSWGERNFINPGFDQETKNSFTMRAIEEMKTRGTTSVLLVPAATGIKLFHEQIWPNAREIRLLKGRPKFQGVNTKGEYVTQKTGQNDIMIAVFEKRPPRTAPDVWCWDWRNDEK